MEDVADLVTAYATDVTAIALAALGIYLLVKGFGWARRAIK